MSDFQPVTEVPAGEFSPVAEAPAEAGGNAREATPASPSSIKQTALSTLKEGAALGDLVWNVVPGMMALGAEAGMRARKLGEGESRQEQARSGQAASQTVMNTFGSPLHKLLILGGLGGDENSPTAVDTAMGKASQLIEKGGEWVEKNTHGWILKSDVESVTNALMQAGGGRGLAAGMKKLVSPEMAGETKKLSVQSLERGKAAERQKADPAIAQADVAKAAEQQATKDTLEDLLPDPITSKPKLKYSEVFGKVDEQGKPLSKESGMVDPKLLARMAAIGVGAWAGAYYGKDHDVTDAILGGAVGFGATKLSIAWSMAKGMKGPRTGIDINGLGDQHDFTTRGAALDVLKSQKLTEDLTPLGRDGAVVAGAESRNHLGLTMNEAKAAQIMSSRFRSLGRVAKVAGIERAANASYARKLWDWSANASNPYRGDSSILTIAQGKARGLTPISENPAYLMGAYTASVAKALADKNYVNGLKSQLDPAGVPLAGPEGTVPSFYVHINHPSFSGMRIHPEIEGSVKMLFDTSDPGGTMRALQAVSDTSKRMAVSFSLFHAKALTDALIAGGSNPLKSLAELPRFAMGTSSYLSELQKGVSSPILSRALKGGLVFSLEKAGAAVEDAGVGFYPTMKFLQGFLDEHVVQGAGKPIAGFMELSHKMDTLMWARLHAGMKLMTFQEKFNQLMMNSAKRGMPLTEERAAKIAASYTNDLFGGLNWRMIADEAKTRFGREVGHSMLNPAARRGLQLLMFAPDWTLSTTRAVTQAFGKGSGVRGLFRPTEIADLHRQYLARAALYYLVVGDTINYSMSGHHLWQNQAPGKDPSWQDRLHAMTFIQLDPKGYHRMQWSKHTMEPIHWLTHPGQQALGKLGYIPKESANQFFGTEYLAPYKDKRGGIRAGPEMDDDSATGRLRHAFKGFRPISVQQGQEGGAANFASSVAGVPVYGKTPEERKKDREEKRKRKKER